MGWSYRKSVNLGPFRVNISKSGIGYSLGGMGFRTGVSSRGRQYRSVSIPGTGLRYSSSSSQQGCLVVTLAFFAAVASITTVILLKVWL